MENSSDILITDVYFRGNAGRLEGKYYSHKDKTSPAVLFLSPEPTYGGDLNNHVIVAMEEVFRKCGFTTLRINYRGVHHSDGVFRKPEDAIQDAAVALDWLHEQNPEASHFWIAGYSFGAWISANIMMRRPEIETFVLVSPLANKYDYSFAMPCLVSGLVIVGEKDELTPMKDTTEMVQKMNETDLTFTTFVSISEAGHLYKNKTQQLSEELERYINTTLATRIAKPIRKKRRKRKKKDTIQI